jgi:hypothetical protein
VFLFIYGFFNFDEFSHPAKVRKLQNDDKKITAAPVSRSNFIVEVPVSPARVRKPASAVHSSQGQATVGAAANISA